MSGHYNERGWVPGTPAVIAGPARTSGTSDVTVRPTVYEVCAYPGDDINRRHFVIEVTHRGNDRWAILQGGFCLSRSTGEWDYESIPSERRDDWLDDHRWSLPEAIERAQDVAPEITLMGKTAVEVAVWAASR